LEILDESIVMFSTVSLRFFGYNFSYFKLIIAESI